MLGLVSDTQIEPMTVSLDDTVIEYTFSEAWLEDTLDNASVLNNFQFLFEFAPEDGLLTMPAVDSERRGLESVFGLDGTHDYLTGHVFTAKDLATLSQTVMYQRFLEARDIDLEEVLRWYFEEHLPSELGITGFAFTPSSSTANYLERCRNLFAEMESIATQYNLFIEDGEIDHDVATAGQTWSGTAPSPARSRASTPTRPTTPRSSRSSTSCSPTSRTSPTSTRT